MADHRGDYRGEPAPWFDLRDDPKRRLCLASVKTGNRPGSCALGESCRGFHALKPIAFEFRDIGKTCNNWVFSQGIGCRFDDCKFAHDLHLVTDRVVLQLMPFVGSDDEQARLDRLAAMGRPEPRRAGTTTSVNEAPIVRKRVWGAPHADVPPAKVPRAEPKPPIQPPPVLRLGFTHSLRQSSRKVRIFDVRVTTEGRDELVTALDAVTRHNALAEAFAKIARALASADPAAEMATRRTEGGDAMVTGKAEVAPPRIANPVEAVSLSAAAPDERKTEPSPLVGLGYQFPILPAVHVETPAVTPAAGLPVPITNGTPALTTAPSSISLSQVATPLSMLSPFVSRSGVVARVSAADLWEAHDGINGSDVVMEDAEPAPAPVGQIDAPAPIAALPPAFAPPMKLERSMSQPNGLELPIAIKGSASSDGAPAMHPDRLRAMSELPTKPNADPASSSGPGRKRIRSKSSTVAVGVQRTRSLPSSPADVPPPFHPSLPIKPPETVAPVAALPAKPLDTVPPWSAPPGGRFSPPRGPRGWVSPTSDSPTVLSLQIRGRARAQSSTSNGSS